MTQQAAPPVASVTDAELDEVFSGPSLFVNKIYVTGGGATARLTFAEQNAGRTPQFRASVTMSLDDLIKLQGLIKKVAENAVQLNPPKLNG